MNDELLSRYEEKQQEDALKMLNALIKRVKKGQLRVMAHGFWEGSNGRWNFTVVTRETDNFRPFTEIP